MVNKLTNEKIYYINIKKLLSIRIGNNFDTNLRIKTAIKNQYGQTLCLAYFMPLYLNKEANACASTDEFEVLPKLDKTWVFC